MAEELAVKTTMSRVLATQAVRELGQNLALTPSQINNARSQALKLSGDDKLRNCDPYTIVKYCFESARYNFTRDDCMYPVPYGKAIQSQFGYRGLRELCLQAGYKEVTCVPVYECDEIYRDEETGQIKVKFNKDYKASIGKSVVGYFAYAIENGETSPSNTLFWDIEKVTEHGKTYSKTFNSVWGTKLGFDKMAKKTLIKQLCNELRTTPLLQEAIKQDQVVHTSIDKDEYLDNPLNERKTNVNNVIDDVDIIDIKEETQQDGNN